MQQHIFKCSVLWMNVGEVAVRTGILDRSCYQCAHFSGNCCMLPQNPVLFHTGNL